MKRLIALLGVLLVPAGVPAQSVETAPAPRARVTAVSKELREKFKLDPFYEKQSVVNGLPIHSSAKVSDAGLVEAGDLIRSMLANRPDVLPEMVKNRCRFAASAAGSRPAARKTCSTSAATATGTRTSSSTNFPTRSTASAWATSTSPSTAS
jgi:hypothetical protein